MSDDTLFPEETYGQRLKDGFIQPEPRVYPPLQTTTLQGRLFDEVNAHKRALRRLVKAVEGIYLGYLPEDRRAETLEAVAQAKELLK